MISCRSFFFLLALFVSMFLIIPAPAVYDFEGIPLATVAQGEVAGDIQTFGTYGLDAPPYQLTFDLPAAPQYGRVYAGIWGGTEKYSGWAELNVNNLKKITYSLYGERDRNRDVYTSGHGIYWIAYDATDLLRKGSNTITVNTSKDEAGNKLDGRVYCVFVVTATEKTGSTVTRYWLAEGNEDLHGEGWAGTNPTRHDETNVTFEGADLSGATQANLSVILLAGGKGQPDYVEFNGNILGVPTRVAGGVNVTDIGDETSFDATGGTGIPSRYVDAETFPVTGLLKETNTVRFLRGIDLNGDGTIATTGDAPEGEDYIHPVLTLLTVTTSATSPTTDVALENLAVRNAFVGETGTITAEVRNYGSLLKQPVAVTFSVDGKTLNATRVTVPASGIAEVSIPWQAAEGTFTVSGEVSADGDANPGNNAVSRKVTVGTTPDLSLSVGNPVHAGSGTGAVQTAKSPLFPLAALGGIALAGLAFATRRNSARLISGVLICLVMTSGCAVLAVPACAASGVSEYTLPVTITNSGGSDAGSFAVTVYLDGEKVAEKTVDGVQAGGTVNAGIPVFTTPGTHTLKVVIDEACAVQDQNRQNNIVQGSYAFPS